MLSQVVVEEGPHKSPLIKIRARVPQKPAKKKRKRRKKKREMVEQMPNSTLSRKKPHRPHFSPIKTGLQSNITTNPRLRKEELEVLKNLTQLVGPRRLRAVEMTRKMRPRPRVSSSHLCRSSSNKSKKPQASLKNGDDLNLI